MVNGISMKRINLAIASCLLMNFANISAMHQRNTVQDDPRQYSLLVHENNPQDHYVVLGVADNATQDNIKEAYKALAKISHPDKTSQVKAKDSSEAAKKLAQQEYSVAYAAAQTKFQAIGNAYAALCDENDRMHYNLHEYVRVKEVKRIKVILDSINAECAVAHLVFSNPLPAAGKLELQDAQKIQLLRRAIINREQLSFRAKNKIITNLQAELTRNDLKINQDLPNPRDISLDIAESIHTQVTKIIEDSKEAKRIIASIQYNMLFKRRHFQDYDMPEHILNDLEAIKKINDDIDALIKVGESKELQQYIQNSSQKLIQIQKIKIQHQLFAMFGYNSQLIDTSKDQLAKDELFLKTQNAVDPTIFHKMIIDRVSIEEKAKDKAYTASMSTTTALISAVVIVAGLATSIHYKNK